MAPPHDTVAQDALWLRHVGLERRVGAGEEVIRKGVPPDYLFVVLEGEFEIRAEGSQPRRRLLPGRLLWEMAYMERIAPKRSIYAATDGVLLCIRPCDVDVRVCHDPSFGARFLRMLRDYALEKVVGGAPAPPGVPVDSGESAQQRTVPEMIEQLLRGEF